MCVVGCVIVLFVRITILVIYKQDQTVNKAATVRHRALENFGGTIITFSARDFIFGIEAKI